MLVNRRPSIVLLRSALLLLPLIPAFTGCSSIIGGLPLTSAYFSSDTPRPYKVHGAVIGDFDAISTSSDTETNETQQTAPPLKSNRQMIYTAQFAIATPEVNETIDRFISEVDSIGGYLESRKDNHIVVRVPANTFDRVVEGMPSLGEVLSRSIKNEDVTRQHRDLRLRIETLLASRQRILQLLKTATDLEGIIKLEEKLSELTLQLEMAQSTLKNLGEQVAFSRVEVDFSTKSLGTASKQANQRSTFSWINQVGADRVASGFAGLDTKNTSTRHTLATLWPGAVEMQLPDGFLMVERQRQELKAVTANDAQLRVRKLVASKNGSLDFWSTALASHLVDRRGYELVDDRTVRDKQNRQGRELTFDVVVGGTPMRYLTTLFVDQRPFWSRTNAIQVIELVAPQDEFQQHVEKFHDGQAWRIVEESPRTDRQMAEKNDRSHRASARGQSPAR
jgi:hypothetical protein